VDNCYCFSCDNFVVIAWNVYRLYRRFRWEMVVTCVMMARRTSSAHSICLIRCQSASSHLLVTSSCGMWHRMRYTSAFAVCLSLCFNGHFPECLHFGFSVKSTPPTNQHPSAHYVCFYTHCLHHRKGIWHVKKCYC